MAPTRTAKTPQANEPSTSKAAGAVKKKPRRNNQQKEPAALPGVQKIKSALRQANRLLAKEKLGADVRVETERRIKALEADLEEAQVSRKERDIAVRYHKIKFFERQKVLRKLNQTKKRLESADASSKPQLETSLTELRVDLNYILHYPKTKKYISLFPPDIRDDLASASSETPVPKVNPNSEEVRSWIRERMESGEILTEPELHLDSRGQETKTERRSTTEWGSKKKDKNGSSSKKAKEVPVEEEDAFFGDDAEDDSE